MITEKLQSNLSVKEITENEIAQVIDYWTKADNDYLKSMGIDIRKMPSEYELETMLLNQIKCEYPQKKSFATIWYLNKEPIGHSNLTDISFGNEASLHLHIWKQEHRKQGYGSILLRESIKIFFEKMQLKKLICEPFAFNPAPSRTLEKIDFAFEKAYLSIPHPICFEQKVNRWVLSAADFSLWK